MRKQSWALSTLIVLLFSFQSASAQTWQRVSDFTSNFKLAPECSNYRLKLVHTHMTSYHMMKGAWVSGLTGPSDTQRLRFDINVADLLAFSLNNSITFEDASVLRKADLTSMEVVALIFTNAGPPELNISYFTHSPDGGPSGLGFDGGFIPLNIRPSNITLEGYCNFPAVAQTTQQQSQQQVQVQQQQQQRQQR